MVQALLHYQSGDAVTVDDAADAAYSISVPAGFHGVAAASCFIFDDAEQVQSWLERHNIPHDLCRDPEHVDRMRQAAEADPQAHYRSVDAEATQIERRWRERVEAAGGAWAGPDSAIAFIDSGMINDGPDPYWLYKTPTFYDSSPPFGSYPIPDLGRIGFGGVAQSASTLLTSATLDSEVQFHGRRHYMWGFPYLKEDLTEVGWARMPWSCLGGIQYP